MISVFGKPQEQLVGQVENGKSGSVTKVGQASTWKLHPISGDFRARALLLPGQVFPTAFQEHNENMLVRAPQMLSRGKLAPPSSPLLRFEVCAPTGSGKTNVAMLTILNVMNQFRLKALTVGSGKAEAQPQPATFEDGSFDLAGFKIVYIAPMKAEGLQTLNVAGHGVRMMDIGGF